MSIKDTSAMHHTTALISPTKRVKLVPPKGDDDEAVSILRSHPLTRRYLRFLPTYNTIEDARIRRQSRAEDHSVVDFYIYVMNMDGTASFAGTTVIFNINETFESCEAGILISPDMQRRGLATESLYTLLEYAFGERKMHRATFETAEDNLPMRSWLEKVLEAKLEANRRDCWKEGEGKYTNVSGYSLLEWEWTGGVKEKLLNQCYSVRRGDHDQ
jgi:RimJ/RimL family protein N-acetyltransferase